jgi:hypothetical protein
MDRPRSSRVRSRLESGRESCELVGQHGQSWDEEAERPTRQGAARPRQLHDPMTDYAFQPSFASDRSW